MKFNLFPRLQGPDRTLIPEFRRDAEKRKHFEDILNLPGFGRKFRKYSKFYPERLPQVELLVDNIESKLSLDHFERLIVGVPNTATQTTTQPNSEESKLENDREDKFIHDMLNLPAPPAYLDKIDQGDVMVYFFGTSASQPTHSRNGMLLLPSNLNFLVSGTLLSIKHNGVVSSVLIDPGAGTYGQVRELMGVYSPCRCSESLGWRQMTC